MARGGSMTQEELFNSLDRGEIAPIYLLHGSERYGCERYLLDTALDEIRKRVLGKSGGDFDLDIFHKDGFDPRRFLDATVVLPFSASRRLVICHDVDQLRSGEQEEISGCLKDPSPSACIVFTARKIDGRLKFYRAFKAPAIRVEFSPPFEERLPYWIRRFAREAGKEISEAAVHHLAECVGRDLLSLHNEVQKVAIYIDDRARIEPDDIKEVTPDVRAYTIFNLVDAIGEKRRDRALYLLGRFLTAGESPVMIVSMIARQLRLIWQAREMLDRGETPRSVGERMRLRGPRQRRFFSCTSMFTRQELAKDLDLVLRADVELKSSRVDRGLILERLVLELCTGPEGRRHA